MNISIEQLLMLLGEKEVELYLNKQELALLRAQLEKLKPSPDSGGGPGNE